MRRRRNSLACLAIVGAAALSAATPASAASCPGVSAGDQQYVDPLACANGGGAGGSQPSSSPGSGRRTTATPSTSPTSASTPSTSPTSASTPSSSATTPATSSSAPSTTASAASSSSTAGAGTGAPRSRHGKLPFTGLDTWVIGALGIGLMGGGMTLRRVTLGTR